MYKELLNPPRCICANKNKTRSNKIGKKSLDFDVPHEHRSIDPIVHQLITVTSYRGPNEALKHFFDTKTIITWSIKI